MLSSGNFQQLLEPRFRKLFYDAYTELDEQFPMFCNVKSSKKAKEYDYHVSGTGVWTEKAPGGPIDEEGIEHGLEVTYVHKAYAKMITVERELVDDDLYNVIEKIPGKTGRGGRATVDIYAAGVLNSGFSVNGYDSVPLFSNSHPLLKGGTCDNLMDAADLSDSTLKLGLGLLRTQVTEEGLKMQTRGRNVIVHPDNEFNLLTILQSAGQAGTPNNDTNVLRGRGLKPVVLDYLTDSDAWFIQDPNLSEINFFWRVKPEFKSTEVFDNMVAKYRGYLRFSVGYSDWRGLVGNTGA